jgi:glyoxylase-like metal-dependent hydrolase (beta-lactamase superfamily II)
MTTNKLTSSNITFTANGVLKTLVSATLATSLSFVSAGEPVWDANKVELEIKQLNQGVYAVYDSRADDMAGQGIPMATSSGIIIGDNSVLLVDTMLNERLNKQLLSLVKSVTDKPIKYAINTSFHGDHSYGNYYLPESIQVIQHANAKQYVDSHFQQDTQFMIQNFGQGRGIEDVKASTGDILIPESGELTIDLGGRQVLVKDFGFAQTGGDLFVWLEKSKVMWTGNAMVSEKPGLPWLLDGHLVATLNTLQGVYDFLPQDATVVPGHSYPVNKSDLKWNIDYLASVKQKVGHALEQGLTLKQTIKQVPMDEFRGYALFDWVHPGLNVPSAYKDLAKAK